MNRADLAIRLAIQIVMALAIAWAVSVTVLR